jgi:hypothetical protein
MAVAEKQLMERCIAECLECVKAAARCATWCIQSEQSPKLAECIRLCWDCVDICTACTSLLARDSRFGAQVCGPCADICDACAAECERHGGMNDVMKQCAAAGRRCAATCREMAA